MFIHQFFHRFYLNNNFIITDKIRLICITQTNSLIFQPQYLLRNEWNFPGVEFYFKAFLINRFQKTGAFVTVNFKNSTADGIRFRFKY